MRGTAGTVGDHSHNTILISNVANITFSSPLIGNNVASSVDGVHNSSSGDTLNGNHANAEEASASSTSSCEPRGNDVLVDNSSSSSIGLRQDNGAETA